MTLKPCVRQVSLSNCLDYRTDPFGRLMLRFRHFHRFPIPIRMLLCSRQVRSALAPRTVVHDLVAENITVDAEVVLTGLAFIPARFAGSLGSFGTCNVAGAAICALVCGWEGC
jgi:hypothetical protein